MEKKSKKVLSIKNPALWIGVIAVALVAAVLIPRSLKSYYPQLDWKSPDTINVDFRLSDYPLDFDSFKLDEEAEAEIAELLQEHMYWRVPTFSWLDRRIGWFDDAVWEMDIYTQEAFVELTYSKKDILVVYYNSDLWPDGFVLNGTRHYRVTDAKELKEEIIKIIDQSFRATYTKDLREAMSGVDVYSEKLPDLLAALIPVDVEFTPADPLSAEDCTAIFSQAMGQANLKEKLTGLQPSPTGKYYIPFYYMDVLLSEFLLYREENINWLEYNYLHSEYGDVFIEGADRAPLLTKPVDQREALQASSVENIRRYSASELNELVDRLGMSVEDAEAYDVTVRFCYSDNDPVRCTYCLLFYGGSFKIVSASIQ